MVAAFVCFVALLGMGCARNQPPTVVHNHYAAPAPAYAVDAERERTAAEIANARGSESAAQREAYDEELRQLYVSMPATMLRFAKEGSTFFDQVCNAPPSGKLDSYEVGTVRVCTQTDYSVGIGMDSTGVVGVVITKVPPIDIKLLIDGFMSFAGGVDPTRVDEHSIAWTVEGFELRLTRYDDYLQATVLRLGVAL